MTLVRPLFSYNAHCTKPEPGKGARAWQRPFRQDIMKQRKTRQDKTRQGKARQGKARQGKAASCSILHHHDGARQGKAAWDKTGQ